MQNILDTIAARLRDRAIKDGLPSPYRVELTAKNLSIGTCLFEDDSDRQTWNMTAQELPASFTATLIAADGQRKQESIQF
jgi:hypothetical protein